MARAVWEGRFLRVVVDGGWEYVERRGLSGIVAIVPITDAGELVLVEQHRVPVGQRVVELPAGLVGDVGGSENEPFEEAARRELLEETGFEAARLERLFEGPVSAGLTDERLTYFLASGCRRVGPGGGDASEDITVHVVPLAEVAAWLAARQQEGLAVDVKTLALLAFWLGARPDRAGA